MSNKDFLRLENEYRDELPRYKEKPKITAVGRPTNLTKKVADFLDCTTKKQEAQRVEERSKSEAAKEIEMDIYLTPI